jgi:transcription antitermination factor NusG
MEPVHSSSLWFALQVKARYEQLVATLLEGKAYKPFLPTYRSTRRWSDRVKRIELPLFPGYLFCQFNPQNRLPILVTPGVLRVVGVGNCPMAVDETEIAAIQAVIKSGLATQPWPFLHVGDRVEIRSGPLMGLDGILIAFKGQKRLIVSVSLLQRSVAVEIDGVSVKAIGSSQRGVHVPASWAPVWKPAGV